MSPSDHNADSKVTVNFVGLRVSVPGLTYGQWLLRLLHGRPDDVGAMDALLVAQLLGFVEPFSSHVPQEVPVTHLLLQVPVHMGEVKRGNFYRFWQRKVLLSSFANDGWSP